MTEPEPILDITKTHRLGPRAFLLFLSRHIRIPLLGLIFLSFLWYERTRVFEDYAFARDFALKISLLLIGMIFLYKVLFAWLEYRGYAYRFDEEFFDLTRGYINRKEIGVVYHQIQTVTIKRDPLDRMLGIGHLIILMDRVPSEVVLPALDRRKAQFVQKELLRKARLHAPRYAPADNGNN